MYRKASNNDFSFVYFLYMHPICNPHLLYEQMTEENFQPIFQNLLSQNILYIFQHKGEDIGMFKLIRYTYRSAHTAYIGGVAVHPLHSGKGNGGKMMQTIINLAKEQNILRLELSVGEQNSRARALYDKLGFKEEGILKKYTYLRKEDIYINEVLMSLLI